MRKILKISMTAIIAGVVVTTAVWSMNVSITNVIPNAKDAIGMKCPKCEKKTLTTCYTCLSKSVTCVACHGKGTLPTGTRSRTKCNNCNGTGKTKQYVTVRKCDNCGYMVEI